MTMVEELILCWDLMILIGGGFALIMVLLQILYFMRHGR